VLPAGACFGPRVLRKRGYKTSGDFDLLHIWLLMSSFSEPSSSLIPVFGLTRSRASSTEDRDERGFQKQPAGPGVNIRCRFGSGLLSVTRSVLSASCVAAQDVLRIAWPSLSDSWHQATLELSLFLACKLLDNLLSASQP
jgi:hypothetical protein